MTLINLTQNEQMMLLDAMALKLGDMPRGGATAAQMKVFAERMSAIENPEPVIVYVDILGGTAQQVNKSHKSIIVLVHDHDDEAANPPGTYEAGRW